MMGTEAKQRIAELERLVAELGRQTAGMPLRIAEGTAATVESTDIRLRCEIPAGLLTTDDTFAVNNIVVITGVFTDSTITDVHNDMDWEADPGALCYIERVDELSDAQGDYWHAYQVKCPAGG